MAGEQVSLQGEQNLRPFIAHDGNEDEKGEQRPSSQESEVKAEPSTHTGQVCEVVEVSRQQDDGRGSEGEEKELRSRWQQRGLFFPRSIIPARAILE